MQREFDPRMWNLLAGVALATGCGSRTISLDGDGSETENTAEAPTTNEDPTSDDECVTDSDCPSFYYCIDGSCEYAPYDDGHHDHDGEWGYYECYGDQDCNAFSLCEFNYCDPVTQLPDCNVVVPHPPPLDIPGQPLRLSFADIDADGSDELIVATATELHAYRPGDPAPAASFPRGIESEIIDDMIGDALDDIPGDDVMLLVGGELHLFGSDGVGLLPPVPQPSPYPGARGLASGEFDELPPVDLLLWGELDSGLVSGLGELTPLLAGIPVDSASARDRSSLQPGYVLRTGRELWCFDGTGLLLERDWLRGELPGAETTFNTIDETAIVGASSVEGWTLLKFIDPQTFQYRDYVGVPAGVDALDHGDLDGDGTDELVLLSSGSLSLLLWNDCRLDTGMLDVVEVELGDHDGDGDAELAVRTGAGTVSLLDIE